MNYNTFSIPSIDPNWDEESHPLCKRAKLDTGTLCNLNCTFCYYKDRLDQMDSFEEIKNRVDYIKTYSLISEIELSGGESSVHPNWFDILEYCSTKFDYISTLSNGQKFSNLDFLKKSQYSGLKEILFSMHGTNEYHDEIVGKKYAYEKLIKAIDNAIDNEVITRINCTVTTSNVNCIDKDFYDVISYYIPLGLKQLNFIFHNYWEDNKNSEPIDYYTLAQPVIQVVANLKLRFPDFDVRLRYAPLCYFPEWMHPNIYGQFQHVFDTTDWNKEIYSGKEYFNSSYKYKWHESLIFAWDAAKQSRLHTYFKPKECYKCKHFKWCDGIEKQLKDHQKVYPR